jgi:hypothetical protein
VKPERASGAAPDFERGPGASDRFGGQIEDSSISCTDARRRTLPLAWALAYARDGLRIFPTGANKKPLIVDWPNAATTDEATIRPWWKRWPYAEIAWAVPADVVVVDLDCKRGDNGIRDFIAHEGMHPDDVLTPQAMTASGGRHLIYVANGSAYRNNTRIKGSAIDLRTSGGNVLLPRPNNGRAWIKPLSTPMARVPGWVAPARVLVPRPQGPARPFSGETPYACAALRRAAQAIEGAPNGAQEATLNRECFSIGTLVGAGEVDVETAIAALLAAADRMVAYAEPWGDLTVKVSRAVEEGMMRPRQRPASPRNHRDQKLGTRATARAT